MDGKIRLMLTFNQQFDRSHLVTGITNAQSNAHNLNFIFVIPLKVLDILILHLLQIYKF